MHLEPEAGRQLRRPAQGGQFRLGLLLVPLGMQVGIVAGVQFHHRRPDAGRGLDLRRLVADEHRHPDAGLAQRRDEGGKACRIAGDIEPALGGALLALFGNKAAGMGFQAQGDRLHLGRGGAFEIQRDADPGCQRLDIGIDDVAAILAQMGGDAVRARGFGQQRGAQGIGPG